MTEPRIVSVGVYVPAHRIEATTFADAGESFNAPGIQETAVPSPDEDAVTMAYEAGKRAIDAADTNPEAIERLVVATTTPPLEEEDVTVELGAMFGMPAGASRELLTGSTAVGTQALNRALRSGKADTQTLVVASDCPRSEFDNALEDAAGAGAAAFVVSGNGGVARVSSSEYGSPYPGTRFRQRGSETMETIGISQYERDAYIEAISGALDGLDYSDQPDAVLFQSPDGKLPYRAGRQLGFETEQLREYSVIHELGDLGAAGPLVGLADALYAGVDRVLIVGYGSGARATAIELMAHNVVPVVRSSEQTKQLTYPEYLRMRGHVQTNEPAGGGAYVSVPSWRRTLDTRFHLRAGRCPRCGQLNIPAEGACRDCGQLVEYDLESLSESGVVEAVTTISEGGAPPEFAQLQSRAGEYMTAIVAFEAANGDRASLPAFVADASGASVSVGDEVRATIRRIYTQEGVTRYGHKVILD